MPSNASRVEWEIDGAPLWFECADTPLNSAPDAMACLCFAASSLAGWRVRFPVSICPLLEHRLKRIGRIWNRWWGTDRDRFEAETRGTPPTIEMGRGTALFLSLGVDSFYTLLRMPEARTIVYVAGYDVQLIETERCAKIERRLHDVAERQGVKVILVRTNLRTHPVFGKLGWDRLHGAALAAVGHLLDSAISKIFISASFPKNYFKPWGSSWKTDFLWSSSRLEIGHFGEELWRLEKLEKIVDEPLVMDHLRVCWEHRNDGLNCGECEKCQRTMLGLVSLRRLEVYQTFPNVETLVAGLQASPALIGKLLPTYRAFLKHDLPPEVDGALRGLIQRTEARIKSRNHAIQ